MEALASRVQFPDPVTSSTRHVVIRRSVRVPIGQREDLLDIALGIY